jgi:hypothetical protein
MASAFPGLTELIEDLGRLPSRIEADASVIIHEAADIMATEVRNEYPEVTGALDRGVKVERVNPFRARVKSTARHAYLYERGSVERMWASGKKTGSMPPANVFIPAAIKARRQMVERLTRLIERQTVRGMTGRLEVKDDGRD